MLSDIARYIYNTQMLQAEAVGYAYTSWRREWRGPGREFVRGLPSSCRWLTHPWRSAEVRWCGS
jgi:hypothetical protein